MHKPNQYNSLTHFNSGTVQYDIKAIFHMCFLLIHTQCPWLPLDFVEGNFIGTLAPTITTTTTTSRLNRNHTKFLSYNVIQSQHLGCRGWGGFYSDLVNWWKEYFGGDPPTNKHNTNKSLKVFVFHFHNNRRNR